MDYAAIVHTVVALMKFRSLWVLSLDRTEWRNFQVYFQILSCWAWHQGVASGLVSIGISRTKHGGSGIKLFNTAVDSQTNCPPTADREFVDKSGFVIYKQIHALWYPYPENYKLMTRRSLSKCKLF